MFAEGTFARMADSVSDIIGDYRAFAALRRERLAARGIDIVPYALSHIAYLRLHNAAALPRREDA